MTALDRRPLAPHSRPKSTANLAGGHAWEQEAELELASHVLTSFLQDAYYRGAGQTLQRLHELVREVDPYFAAQLALFARRRFQLRTVSHVLAAELPELVKGQPWARRFYRDLAVRADDVTAILARREAACGLHPLPNSLKRGLADALRQQDEYGLAKYRPGTAGVALVDAVNLCRPRETPALRALVRGTLAAPDTWEVALTRAGQTAGSRSQVRLAKALEWDRLVRDDQLGYMALLRNLRNVAAYCSPAAQDVAAARVADPERVRRSRQLPFRFATAFRELRAAEVCAPALEDAVAQALEIAVGNVPELDGETLVAVDTSGSMLGAFWTDGARSPIETATLFAAAVARRSRADVLLFDTRVQWYTVDPERPIADIDADLRALVTGGGTDFHLIFEHARKRYDRIVILSDMQAWVPRLRRRAVQPAERLVPAVELVVDDHLAAAPVVPFRAAGRQAPGDLRVHAVLREDPGTAVHPYRPADTVSHAYRNYRLRTGADPMVYCFDLAGYGTRQFLDRRVVQLAGFSEKVFDLMPLVEQGGDALLEAIRAVEI